MLVGCFLSCGVMWSPCGMTWNLWGRVKSSINLLRLNMSEYSHSSNLSLFMEIFITKIKISKILEAL